jgi:hypothetical protein
MQPCNRIYYSTVHWRLDMIRAAYRSSLGALTVFAASGLHTHVVTGRSQLWVETEFPLRLDYGRSPRAYVDQRLQIELELLMISGVPLETCSAFNKRWNNKFYYKVAYCWLFLPSHTTMHESMNIKKKVYSLFTEERRILFLYIMRKKLKFNRMPLSLVTRLNILISVSRLRSFPVADRCVKLWREA